MGQNSRDNMGDGANKTIKNIKETKKNNVKSKNAEMF